MQTVQNVINRRPSMSGAIWKIPKGVIFLVLFTLGFLAVVLTGLALVIAGTIGMTIDDTVQVPVPASLLPPPALNYTGTCKVLSAEIAGDDNTGFYPLFQVTVFPSPPGNCTCIGFTSESANATINSTNCPDITVNDLLSCKSINVTTQGVNDPNFAACVINETVCDNVTNFVDNHGPYNYTNPKSCLFDPDDLQGSLAAVALEVNGDYTSNRIDYSTVGSHFSSSYEVSGSHAAEVSIGTTIIGVLAIPAIIILVAGPITLFL